MAEAMRGDGTVYRQNHSRYWWISYWVKGPNGKRLRRRESSNSESFETAHDLLNLRRAEALIPAAAQKIQVSTPETVTIRELVEDLLAWYQTENPRPTFHADTLSRWSNHLQPFFGELKAAELGTAHLREYRVKRAEQKAAFATINRELQILRKAYKLGAESEPPRVMRIPKFKGAIGREKNARKVFIDAATVQKLKEAAGKEGLWARAFLEIAFTLGWRKSEIQSLTVGNIHLAENTIRIEDSKNGEPREVGMIDTLRLLVQPLIIGRKPQEPLFPVKNFRYAWKRICAAAGVKAGKADGFVLHDTRRTSAKSKRFAGVSESVIMDIHGWKGSAMFRRYGIVDQADRMQALMKESQFLEAQNQAAQTEKTATSGLRHTSDIPKNAQSN